MNMKLRISPLSLIIRCSLNPKDHPMEHFPRSARPSNVLWIRIRWLRQTRKGGKSTKLIPVQLPGRTFLMKMVRGSSTPFSSSTKRLLGGQTRKQVFQMFTDIPLVIMLEAAETTGMEQDKNNRHLSITHAVRIVAMFGLPVYNHIFFLLQCKFLAKIIDQTINLRNFKLGT